MALLFFVRSFQDWSLIPQSRSWLDKSSRWTSGCPSRVMLLTICSAILYRIPYRWTGIRQCFPIMALSPSSLRRVSSSMELLHYYSGLLRTDGPALAMLSSSAKIICISFSLSAGRFRRYNLQESTFPFGYLLNWPAYSHTVRVPPFVLHVPWLYKTRSRIWLVILSGMSFSGRTCGHRSAGQGSTL